MIGRFEDLREFIRMRDEGLLDISGFDGILSRLDYGLLLGVLARGPFRAAKSRKWLRSVGDVLGRKIGLKVTLSKERPYMTEGGIVSVGIGTVKRPSVLLFALAHEAAHFILLSDEDYPNLKALEGEYCEKFDDARMRSPIEYAANLVTLDIFRRCMAAAGEGPRETVSRLLGELETAIR